MAAYRVLVVEDNREVRRMVTASIKTLGAEIDVLDVPSAEEALFISASLPLDLVILDFRLPGMSGVDMVTRLRKRRPETKIILVTGVEDTTVRQQVAEASVEAYFFKPIEINKFLEAVKNCLWPVQPEPIPPSTAPKPATIEPVTRPVKGHPPTTSEAGQPAKQGLMPTLDERLSSLKQQVKAVSVLLVNDAGQVLEVAGNPSQITSGSDMLSALTHAFRASQQISQAMGKGVSTSLQYFAVERQCLYVVPVGMNHALFAIISGHFEPDKLAKLDHSFQAAAQDLQAILANAAAEERVRQEGLEKLKAELPAEVIVDPETRAKVEDMFAKAAEAAAKEGADSFWEALVDNEAQGREQGKDMLSYDQARDLGLAPGEDKPA